jgi:DNA-binding Xre family transcriptional regulator
MQEGKSMIDSTSKKLDTHVFRLKIKEVAEAKGYNISQLSRKADVPLSTLRRAWNNQEYAINLRILAKIAKTLNVDVNELLESVPDKEE